MFRRPLWHPPRVVARYVPSKTPSALSITAEVGAFTLTGGDAALKVGRKLIGEVATFTLTGNDATLTKTGALTLTAEVGAFTLTGNAATLKAGRKLVADAAAYVLSGQDVLFNRGRTLAANVGTFTLTGNNVNLTVGNRTLSAQTASFALTGNAATLTYTSVSTTQVPTLSIPGVVGLNTTSVRPFVTITFEQIFPDGLLNLEDDPLWLGDEALSLDES